MSFNITTAVILLVHKANIFHRGLFKSYVLHACKKFRFFLSEADLWPSKDSQTVKREHLGSVQHVQYLNKRSHGERHAEPRLNPAQAELFV
jgi:hypothetical protein